MHRNREDSPMGLVDSMTMESIHTHDSSHAKDGQTSFPVSRIPTGMLLSATTPNNVKNVVNRVD